MNPSADLEALEDPHLDTLANRLHLLGLPVLTSQLSRAYCDINRAETEWDAGMFRDALPARLSSGSGRVRAGLGLFPRFLPPRIAVNRRRLSLASAQQRWIAGHRPYHRMLSQLLRAGRERFGYVVLLDLHSMPQMPGERLPDLVLGDGFGRACANAVPQAASHAAHATGLSVARNYPYAGGHITQNYGRPNIGVHTLQLEFSRPMYMDEKTRALGPNSHLVAETVAGIVHRITDISPSLLRPAPATMAGED